MHVNAGDLDEETRLTVDAAMELANVVTDEPPDMQAAVRDVLIEHDFSRAADASDVEVAAFAHRAVGLSRLFTDLPDLELADAVSRVNRELEVSAIAPSLSAHDGHALHIHWTAPTSPFAHQVAIDLLMALAQTLCDHGVDRFGRCGAVDCEHVFYDTTKNSSRRFCSDPRCSSRTHTAAHRARQAAGA